MSDNSEDRFGWTEGEMFIIDPETNELKRVGPIPEKYREEAKRRGIKLDDTPVIETEEKS